MSDDIETRTMRRVYWRLIPFLFLLLVVNYLDRVNIGFAALRMNADLGLSATAFGFGASIFFVGYALFEVPSNLILHRVGARVWIARILVSWGLVSGCMAFVQGETSFYVLRFLLGVAEGGFLPGVVYYLTQWFPIEHRSKANSGVVAATALASVVGSPLSGAILTYMPEALGLRSWQWMFLLEAAPAVLLGGAVLIWLTERPEAAAWLPADEKAWLTRRLRDEQTGTATHGDLAFWQVVRLGRVWALAALFTCFLTALYGVLLWLPQIIKGFGGLSDVQVGLIAALPFLCGGAAMLLWARHSDRARERKWHLAASLALGGIGLLGSAYAPNNTISFVSLCFAAAGIWGGLGIFWSLTGDFLSGGARAAGIALINTLAQLGGLVGPWMTGVIRDWAGSFSAALAAMAGAAFVAALIAALLSDRMAHPAPAATTVAV
ncbi:MFS transporter [Methylobacterium mesophilicum SR1.6/6]|uniref:MFS transporter n=1 Tax=Methylobacterium mesophilicum SR1.6/6 TaxID=908290 RepID=A0A6B9FIH8_9HYPH|nr:MFS transporter [Methylobacterium mesophilicum]QGY01576.1 MFS transporter [Methylobacterium mesophilicum SR1.6/6]